ncbi:MAG: hypothetical protein AAB794_00380 [Patescibacteria group bacterium]
MRNNLESGKKAEKKEAESTLQESEAMNRYIDLQASAHKTFMSDEEQTDFGQDLIDLVKLLNEGKGISPDFCRDILTQVKRVEGGISSTPKSCRCCAETRERKS